MYKTVSCLTTHKYVNKFNFQAPVLHVNVSIMIPQFKIVLDNILILFITKFIKLRGQD